MSQRIVHTRYGALSGVSCGNPAYTVFKGVPYALPPTGENRWRAPQEPDGWDGVKVCDTFPPLSVQPRHTPGEFYQREFFPVQFPMNEDCLYLNIWTPSPSAWAEGEQKLAENRTACPVMVWIHGGAFFCGYGHEMEFDGEAFCKRGVVLVTINYRLGAMGYFAHTDGISGNFGLLDQMQALRWVHENIAAFGGDPSAVTVFGQSAGGGSVLALIASPLTRGLIHRAIIQSAGVTALGGPYRLEESARFGAFVCEHHHLTLNELRTMPAETVNNLVMATAGVFEDKRWLRMLPCVDGKVLPDDPGDVIARGEHLAIPYMAGSVTGDAQLFGGNEPAWGRLKSESHPLYVYHFNRDMPGGDGAFHSSELWYVFGTLARCWRPMTGYDYELSLRMTDYWTNFAKDGDPNGHTLPVWPSYTSEAPQIMCF